MSGKPLEGQIYPLNRKYAVPSRRETFWSKVYFLGGAAVFYGAIGYGLGRAIGLW